MKSPFAEFLDGMGRLQETVRKGTARVEALADPDRPGLTAYRITGPRAAVQAVIERHINDIDEHGGAAEFTHPVQRIGGEYVATGYALRTVREAAE